MPGQMNQVTKRSGRLVVAFILVAALSALCLGCSSSSSGGSSSSSSSSYSSSSSETINGYSVAEYNSDVDYLAGLLSDAQYYDNALSQMGDPNSFTSQEQVDEYNYYVESYNAAADAYNSAAQAFSSKYGMAIDGTGTNQVDPDQIDLPPYK